MYTTQKKPLPPREQIFLWTLQSPSTRAFYIYIYNFPQTKTPYLKITASSNHAVISYQQVLSGSKRMDVTKLA